MPRRLPTYRKHSTRNYAIIEVDGQRISLAKHGKYGSRESKAAYAALLADLVATEVVSETAADARRAQPICGTIEDLVLAFMAAARLKYRKHGKPTSEVSLFKAAVRPLLAPENQFATLPVNSFEPADLIAVRDRLIANGHCRKKVNQHVGRIRAIFRWGVQRRLASATVWHALKAVEGLRYGEAPERPKITGVSQERVEAVRLLLTPQVRAMVDFQRLTGARPGEACLVRWRDIDRSRDPWEYRPHTHKTEHHGKERVVLLGPQCQALLSQWPTDSPDEYLWRPADGRQSWLDASWEAAGRKHRRGTRARQRRRYRDHYTAQAYGHAIARACERLWPTPAHLDKAAKAAWRAAQHWRPNQLRHATATRIRARFGLEVARAVLGHSSAVTSEIYAEMDRDTAEQAVAMLG